MGRIFLILIVVVALMGGCSFYSSYNKMVDLEEKVEVQWSNVEASYQRRADLVPNLVNTAKAAAEVEKEIFTNIASARSNVANFTVDEKIINNPEKLKQFQKVQGELSSALSRLIAVQERYPELKSNRQFEQLAVQLEGTENRINQERRKYSESAGNYNSYIKKLPNNIWANLGDFDEKAYFEADEGTESAPTVDFNN